MARTAMNLEENLAGILCYMFLWISGIIFFILEKENKFVRFHAIQSVLTFLPLSVVIVVFNQIPFSGRALAGLVWILVLILWAVLMYKAYKGEEFKLPIVGNLAEKQTE